MIIEIVLDHGIFYINGKRLGHDTLTDLEANFLNEFIKELKKSQS